MTDTNATLSTVFGGIETLITNALGDHESAATRARIHAATSALSAVGSILEPLLADHLDAQGLISGLSQVEQGAQQIEQGIEDVLAAVRKKGAPIPTVAPSSSSTGGIG
ncbi:hypothetical protein CO583_01975 [Parasaccharibacter sp. TMW2.1882]|uniref:hypothetical protein n=1 Tax=Acetobacteraceae TaxID=433 RepID=UPI0012B71598|nr:MULTISPECIES: hypothetical protein [Acetobacteraceae]MCL1496278.1 hypothetical protein [Parasaccharibacter sp. TMW2.1882]MPV99797.1 hypothetical protein [Bombella apis]